MECLTDLDVLGLVEGSASPAIREQLLAHSDTCATCRTLLVAVGRAQPREGEDGEVVARGAVVGRYVVTDLIGVGAMSEVHGAFDPVLERKVALKLLREDAGSHARLVQEGVMMARLSHPHVVPVFDVGSHGDRVYVAMEYVDGRTLRAWLDERDRSWREIAAAFAHAGRGLEAAHAESIIHRDFKPENVLVGRDERVRVVDFGLSHTGGDAAPQLAGTPAYMAPELLDRDLGGDPAAPADQFAFCVALYEALYGVRPFAGETIDEIAAHAKAGELAAPRVKRRVPAWLHRAVLRGLAARPADRFPSMTELVRVLERDPRRLLPLVILGILAALAAAVLVVRPTRDDSCSGGGESFATAWNPDRRAAMHAAFAATALPYVDVATRTVDEQLDAYTDRWVGMFGEACRAAARNEQSPETLDLRMACLDDRRRKVAALVDVFARADRDVVENAVRAVGSLPEIEACADTAALRAPVAPPPTPAARAELERLRGELARVAALQASGKYRDALAVARDALTAARTFAYAPAIAAAAYSVGVLEAETGDATAGVATLAVAAQAASEGHDDPVTTEALLELARLHADKLQKLEAASAFVGPAAWSLARWGGPPQLQARLLDVRALILDGQGKHGDATPLFEQSLALRERAFGADTVVTARAVVALAENRRLRHEYDKAFELYRRALALFEKAEGAGHPDVGVTLNDLGSGLMAAGRFAEARAPLERSLAVRRAALGPNHPDVGRTLSNLANLSVVQRRLDDAETYSTQALAVKEATLGPMHPSLAFTLVVLADVELQRGRTDDALAHTRRALAIREKALPPGHEYIFETLMFIAQLQLARNELPDALAMGERLAAAFDAQKDVAMVGMARYIFGRILWAHGDRARAVPLFAAAGADFTRAGGRGAGPKGEMDAWLAKTKIALP